MFAIETELGRFEADTEKEAKALLRKAAKAQAEIDADENRKRTEAYKRAKAQGFDIYDRKLNEKRFPPGWRILNAGNMGDLSSVREGYDTKRCERFYEIETADGRARVYPYDRITHYLENGSGFCMAVVIENQDCELFAVGVFEDRCAWVALFGVKADNFPSHSK